MDSKLAKDITKYVSYILRQDPEEAGITLDANGWTPVDRLIEQVQYRFPQLDQEMLHYIVATNNKQLFVFNEDKTMIRASEGHSVDVALNYIAQEPPVVLFHATPGNRVASIMQEGLKKQDDHYIQLSENVTTALDAGGSYHEHAIILKIRSGKMHEAGYVFYLSANRVWFTDYVPPEYIEDDF